MGLKQSSRIIVALFCKEPVREDVQSAGGGLKLPAREGVRVKLLVSWMTWSTRSLNYSRGARRSNRLRQSSRHKLSGPKPAKGVLLPLFCVLACGGLVAWAKESCCAGDGLDCSASSVEHQGQVRPTSRAVLALIVIVVHQGWSWLSNELWPSPSPSSGIDEQKGDRVRLKRGVEGL